MKNKREILDKLNRLQVQLNSWVRDESHGQSEEHRIRIIAMVRSDHDFVDQLLHGVTTNAGSTRLQITAHDMKRCNSIHRHYSAISDIQFDDQEPDPLIGATHVNPNDSR
jgi:hypothetical protein